MGVNNLDQRAPALDVWVSLPQVGGSKTLLITPESSAPVAYTGGSLDGYSISCIPGTAGGKYVTEPIARGRNIYAQLLAGIRSALGAGWVADVYIELDARNRYQVALRLARTPATAWTEIRLRMPVVVDAIPSRWASARWLGFETADGQPMDIVFTSQTRNGIAGLWAVTKYGPVGLWQPEHTGWTTLADREPNYRVTTSPYDGRIETRLFWGVRDTTTMRWEMVHAAQVYRDRNADIPCEGWASAAHLARLRGVTLERLLPWMAHARPQYLGPTGDVSLWANDGVNNLSSDPAVHAYDPAWGCPIIAYLDPAAIAVSPVAHKGYPMMAFRSGNTIYPAGYNNVAYRHYTLQESVTLRSLTEDQLGARRLRVSIPFYDVTHPATYQYTTIGSTSTALEGPTMGGDY